MQPDDPKQDEDDPESEAIAGTAAREVSAPPDIVRDLADACVRFVERALGVRLDYAPETLPLLDHYLAEARATVAARPETVPLLADAAGAYFGEVVRRRHASRWRIDGDDPASFRIELAQVYLAITPAALARDALLLASDGGEAEAAPDAGIELAEDDRAFVAERLAELPAVPEDEFYALSTRLEVIDIAVDALHGKRIAEDEPELVLGPADYDRA